MLPLLILLALCGCTSTPEPTVHSGVAMTIPYHVITASPHHDITEIIHTTFQEIHHHSNNWNRDSEISQLNALLPGQQAPLSPHLHHLLVETDKAVHLTGGLFDPTLSGDWDKIHFEDGTFWKEVPLTLDLCGVAKGYCVDLLVERLKEYGSVYVCWGGEIRAHGHHPAGRPWRCALRTPEGGLCEVIDLDERAIATSGTYYQGAHVHNPLTLSPVATGDGSIASATVRAPSCLMADALATALLLGCELPPSYEVQVLPRKGS